MSDIKETIEAIASAKAGIVERLNLSLSPLGLIVKDDKALTFGESYVIITASYIHPIDAPNSL
jgi:chorismate-pyruvate lyase